MQSWLYTSHMNKLYANYPNISTLYITLKNTCMHVFMVAVTNVRIALVFIFELWLTNNCMHVQNSSSQKKDAFQITRRDNHIMHLFMIY